MRSSLGFLVATCCLLSTAEDELPYRILHVNLGVGRAAQGPSGEPAHVASVISRFAGTLDLARRHGYSHVLIAGLEDYVPDEDPVGRQRAERFRPYLQAAIREAHTRGLKVLLYGDEAIYRPAWLERTGARPSVKDPRFWEMLADKYRRLLRTYKDLDGVGVRIGEVIPYRGYEALDLLHSAESEPDPRLEERVRRYLLTAHRVIAGEFGKLFLFRTWTTSDWELHSVPAIYRGIFTREIPVQNLLVSIKLTKQDAWYYGSAFNPTFGQTAHTTVAEAELYSQYHGSGTIVDFPARWMAAALRYARLRGTRGVVAAAPGERLLARGIFTVFSRLAQNPWADEEELTRQWTAQEFGQPAAASVAEILLESSEAVRDVFYLPAFLTLGWNPLPHVRVNRIVARGDPLFDEGRGHDEFLRDLYLMSKPYLGRTRESVTRGHERFVQLRNKYLAVRDRITQGSPREQLEELLDHSVATSALLRDYVLTVLSYFEYREKRTPALRARLSSDLAALRASAEAYRRRHRFYDLAGVEVTIKLASRMLEDPERAEQVLRQAPTREELSAGFARAREESLRLLAADPRAEKIVRWQGTVDGRAIVSLRGREASLEILAGDGVADPVAEFFQPVTIRSGGRWLLRPVRARGVAFLLESPSEGNRGTARVYLDDPDPGNAIYEFELYWSKQTP